MIRRYTIHILFISLSCLFDCQAQVGSLFDRTDVLELQLRADWDAFVADRSDTATYHPAYLSYLTTRAQKTLPVEIKVRGNFRRRKEICAFPPIRLKVKKSIREGTLFEGSRRLKMVTHCRDESYVLKEYLIYQLYELLVGEGFRTRLAKIHYVDKHEVRNSEERFGFFIESEKMLEKRLEGKLLEDTVAQEVIHHDALSRLMVFEYMVGNLDWSVEWSKNIRLLQRPGQASLIPIPYDFDWSGMVGAPYTGLGEEFDYRCKPPYCRSKDEFQAVVDEFLTKEQESYDLLKDFPYLANEEKREMLQYWRKSFRLIQKKEIIERVFPKACEGEAEGK